ncbi:unnamed protein product [Coccothraustes coccothraustes]
MLRSAEGRKAGRAAEGQGPAGAIPRLRHSRTAPPGAAHSAPHREQQVRPATGAGANPARGPPQTTHGEDEWGHGTAKRRTAERGMERAEETPPRRSPAAQALPPRAAARSDAQRQRAPRVQRSPSALPADLKPRTARRSRCASPPAGPAERSQAGAAARAAGEARGARAPHLSLSREALSAAAAGGTRLLPLSTKKASPDSPGPAKLRAVAEPGSHLQRPSDSGSRHSTARLGSARLGTARLDPPPSSPLEPPPPRLRPPARSARGGGGGQRAAGPSCRGAGGRGRLTRSSLPQQALRGFDAGTAALSEPSEHGY